MVVLRKADDRVNVDSKYRLSYSIDVVGAAGDKDDDTLR